MEKIHGPWRLIFHLHFKLGVVTSNQKEGSEEISCVIWIGKLQNIWMQIFLDVFPRLHPVVYLFFSALN